MSWSDDCEVAVVERGDLGQLVAFGEGDDRGVNEAESEIGVCGNQFDGALVVDADRVDDREPGAGSQREEACFGGRAEAGFDQPGSFGDDGRGNREIGPGAQQGGASSVVGSSRSAVATKTPVSMSSTVDRQMPWAIFLPAASRRSRWMSNSSVLPDAAQPMNASKGSSSRAASSSMSVSVVIPRRSASAVSREASCSIVIDMTQAYALRRRCCSRSSRVRSGRRSVSRLLLKLTIAS